MNTRAAFIITGSILFLVAQSHRTVAADMSAELFAAVKSGEAAKVGQLLAAGADPNARGPAGLTPLLSAAIENRADIAKLLLENGADINAKSDNGMTALMVAAVKGHKEVTQLLVTNGADANIRNKATGLTPFQMATLGKHQEVAALLRPHTTSAQDQETSLFGMSQRFVVTAIYPCLFGMLAVFFLVIGLRGIVTKKPFAISARWLFIIVLLGFTPGILQAASFPTRGDGPAILNAVRWLLPIVLIVVLIFLAFTLRGYVAFGVTDASFREGLLTSLKKLNLHHEETLSVLRLPTIGADLQVAVQSWIGTAQIKMRQRQFGKVLDDIAKGMNDYYQNAVASKMNLTCCIFYTILGVLMIVFGAVLLFGFTKIH